MVKLKQEYEKRCVAYSDINKHLPTLCKYAEQCVSVFETGVRGVISSYALFYGLSKNPSNNKRMLLNDITACDVQNFLSLTNEVCPEIEVKTKWCNNLLIDFEEEKFDLTFIDTWHVYGQLKRELEKFSAITKKYIIIHDTTVDEWLGESVRQNMDVKAQAIESGYPEDEITKGLWYAIEEFLQVHTEWKLKERFFNNNGLTVLELDESNKN
jgi:hypothetical protein